MACAMRAGAFGGERNLRCRGGRAPGLCSALSALAPPAAFMARKAYPKPLLLNRCRKTERMVLLAIGNDSRSVSDREADKWLLENPSVPSLGEKDREKENGRRYERSV